MAQLSEFLPPMQENWIGLPASLYYYCLISVFLKLINILVPDMMAERLNFHFASSGILYGHWFKAQPEDDPKPWDLAAAWET